MKSEEELELEDIAEQAEMVGKLTPIEYARLRGMKPQMVFYWIRTEVLVIERCICGRKVLDVANSDEALQAQKSKRRGVLDTRPDELRSEPRQRDVLQDMQETDPLEGP